MVCSICGESKFSFQKVLWPKLVEQWGLSPEEEAYINRQQGEACTACGGNIRSIALADAIRTFLKTDSPFNQIHAEACSKNCSILEVNEAGNLTNYLEKFRLHQIVRYPQVDLQSLPFRDFEFDLVIHSDTLEHIENPMKALSECFRVLKVGGALCFTVPTIVGRMTRSRKNLEESFHGDPANNSNDLLVHFEFGADVWTYILGCGFSNVRINSASYPAGLAFLAVK